MENENNTTRILLSQKIRTSSHWKGSRKSSLEDNNLTKHMRECDAYGRLLNHMLTYIVVPSKGLKISITFMHRY